MHPILCINVNFMGHFFFNIYKNPGKLCFRINPVNKYTSEQKCMKKIFKFNNFKITFTLKFKLCNLQNRPTSISIGFQIFSSISRERALEQCTPRFRCIPSINTIKTMCKWKKSTWECKEILNCAVEKYSTVTFRLLSHAYHCLRSQ